MDYNKTGDYRPRPKAKINLKIRGHKFYAAIKRLIFRVLFSGNKLHNHLNAPKQNCDND